MNSRKPKACVPRRLNDEQQERSVSVAIEENEANRPQVNDFDGFEGRDQLAVVTKKLWKPGRTLRVRFLNGDDVQQAKCIREAKRWEQYANIKFVASTDDDAEIRVAFNDGKIFTDPSSWSYLGTDCLLTPKNEQTMNLGWLRANTTDFEWRRVATHEFGHALGCEHEDQQPAASIKWDRNAVYKWYMGPPNNWSKEDVDSQVLDPLPPLGIEYTEFDPVSIMAYWIPPEFTLDGKGVEGGNDISETDKKLISRLYPPLSLPTVTDPELVPGKPELKSTLSPSVLTNRFKMVADKAGTYRVWSSLLAGVVAIIKDDNTLIARGLQQVTTPLEPGTYRVETTNLNPAVSTTYRIVARRIK